MQISIVLNGKKIQEEIEPDLLLIDFVRKHGCKSVKRGCETSGCGLAQYFWMTSRYYPVLFWQPE